MPTIRKLQKYRRADNGEYTTKRYAEKNPETTVKETDKRSLRHKRKKR